MKLTISTLAVIAFLISCNSDSGKREEINEVVRVIPIENLENSAMDLSDKIIQTTGMVTHICRHGGQKMFLTDDTKECHILVRVSSSIPEFDISLEGSTLEITGKLVATISEAMDHEGHDHSEEEECAAETKMKENSGSDECTTNVTYHLEALSYKEIY